MSYEQIAEALKKYHPTPDLVALKKAYDFAEECHRGQVRASGEPYFKHVEETAMLVCQLKLDEPSVIASLLHDTIEDSDVTREDLQKEFHEAYPNRVRVARREAGRKLPQDAARDGEGHSSGARQAL
jgi:GTP pyrophosphokinase